MWGKNRVVVVAPAGRAGESSGEMDNDNKLAPSLSLFLIPYLPVAPARSSSLMLERRAALPKYIRLFHGEVTNGRFERHFQILNLFCSRIVLCAEK